MSTVNPGGTAGGDPDPLAGIRASFVGRLDRRLETIRDSLSKIGTKSGELATLHRHLHSLHGSAATFGFPELAHLSHQAERSVAHQIAHSPAEPDLSEVRTGIEAIESRVRILMEGGSPEHDTPGRVPDTAADRSPPADTPVDAPAGVSAVAPADADAAPERGRIAVVEDDRAQGDALVARLEAAGYRCTLHTDGESAVEAIPTYDPDLILLDLVLPGIDGIEVCRRIREIGSLADVPVFFLTAVEGEGDTIRAYEVGADDYLVKPVRPPVLFAKVKSTISRRQRRRIDALSDPRPGAIVDGRYRMIEEIGRGGMGAVYRVEDMKLSRIVALKCLPAEMPADEADRLEDAARFRREIETLIALRHPNIVTVHDAGHWGSTQYYVMDLLEGGSMADLFDRQGCLEAPDALDMAASVADGLAAAHRHGVIHRDVKPANILFGADPDHPILSDFGLARPTRAGRTRLTRPGMIVGTPRYMAPEWIHAGIVDERVDVYALGVTLYELLTGLPYFVNHSGTEVISLPVEYPIPSIRETFTGFPVSLDRFCRSAMARKVSRRIPSAVAFAEEARWIARKIRGDRPSGL